MTPLPSAMMTAIAADDEFRAATPKITIATMFAVSAIATVAVTVTVTAITDLNAHTLRRSGRNGGNGAANDDCGGNQGKFLNHSQIPPLEKILA